MVNFIITSLLWTFALYGLFEICKTIIHIHKYPKVSFNGSSFIITVHNQENNIEYFLRVFIYKMLYYNLNISEIIIVDLDSTDNTLNILKTFSKDFERIQRAFSIKLLQAPVIINLFIILSFGVNTMYFMKYFCSELKNVSSNNISFILNFTPFFSK